jgi:hypothetical protein
MIARDRVDYVKRSALSKKELSMTASQMGRPSAETLHAKSATSRPMPQQDGVGSHGYDMHPQKFVRLVGCHEPEASQSRQQQSRQQGR